MVDDPFASVWDETSLARQRDLLQRVTGIAEKLDIALYLDFGTLLGHVREGRILLWDDDVDLVIFDEVRRAELCAALHYHGLSTVNPQIFEDRMTKIYDPAYARTSAQPWTWPAVDVFLFLEKSGLLVGRLPRSALPRDIVLPGRVTLFEGARCWEPEQPLAVLDRRYPKWRSREVTSLWNHRDERANDQVYLRYIQTDAHGRKVRQVEPPTSEQ
jgi:hypothetical protein